MVTLGAAGSAPSNLGSTRGHVYRAWECTHVHILWPSAPRSASCMERAYGTGECTRTLTVISHIYRLYRCTYYVLILYLTYLLLYTQQERKKIHTIIQTEKWRHAQWGAIVLDARN